MPAARPYYLVVDAETTEKELAKDPRLVGLAWARYDARGRRLDERYAVVRPDGFTIPRAAAAVHGLTTARARREGRPRAQVLEEFMAALRGARAVVAHPLRYDCAVLDRELDAAEDRAALDAVAGACTMDLAEEHRPRPDLNLSLPIVHAWATGAPYVRESGVPVAVANTRACADVLFALLPRRARAPRRRPRAPAPRVPAPAALPSPAEAPYLVVDVETNGRFQDVPEVRIVRLAWGLYDTRGRERGAFHDAIVYPDFEIPAEATAIHGITTARARAVGRPLADVLRPFVAALAGGRTLVAHGLQGFDWPVIAGELRRTGLTAALPAAIDGEDTARLFWARYPDLPRHASRLPEAHRRVVGRPMAEREGGVHDAAADVRACAALFFALQRTAAARPGGA